MPLREGWPQCLPEYFHDKLVGGAAQLVKMPGAEDDHDLAQPPDRGGQAVGARASTSSVME